MKEVWKDVVEYPEHFMISNHGRVWSKRTHKILKPVLSATGYPMINTRFGGRKGKAVSKRVHRWVCEAFLDNPEQKPFVNHKDGVKTNNHVENLEWCTAKENSQHAVETGLACMDRDKGWNNIQAKLTEDDVVYIRSVYKPRHKMFGSRALARELGVNKNRILQVASYRSYNI